MITLAIDTATSICSVALLDNGALISERTELARQKHGEYVLPFVDDVLQQTGKNAEEIDLVAVSIGPGSFTGLRIGLSIAKGIAVGVNKPIVPVPTLAAIAYGVYDREGSGTNLTVSTILPARRNEYYYARFKIEEEFIKEVSPVRVLLTEGVLQQLQIHTEDIPAGEGIERLSEEAGLSQLSSGIIKKTIDMSLEKGYHRTCGYNVARLVRHYPPAHVEDLEPFYFKDFQSGSLDIRP